MDELKDKGKRVMENIGEKRVDMIQKWEEKSRDFIDTFLLLFGREGRLVSHYSKSLGTMNSQCNESENCCNLRSSQDRQ
jgi:choline-phosphate cytidylyltransferase